MRPPRVHLSIDRLVLNGVAAEQRHVVVAALTAELQRRLAVPGGVAALGGDRHLAKLRTEPLRVSSVSGAALGSAAARGIDGALKR
jgi:hypothetical protein